MAADLSAGIVQRTVQTIIAYGALDYIRVGVDMRDIGTSGDSNRLPADAR